MLKDLCFEIIDTCPNHCKFCSSRSCSDLKTKISFEDFKRVIDYFLKKGGISELFLSGGEPFLHPDLLKMIEYSKKNNIRTVLFTSGVKKKNAISKKEVDYYRNKMNKDIREILEHEPWNNKAINNIKKYYMNFMEPPIYSSINKNDFLRLKELGLDKIVFDYQGYTQETDMVLMGRNYEKRNCLLNSLINAAFSNIPVDIHFIPMKPNYKEIEDIIEMLEIIKIQQISILNFIPQGRGKDFLEDLKLDDQEMETFLNIINKLKLKYKGNIRVSIPLQNNNLHKCNAGLEKLDIKYDGTILPCPAFKELDYDKMKKYGIERLNIYENLNEVEVLGGTRMEPLCQKIYQKKK